LCPVRALNYKSRILIPQNENSYPCVNSLQSFDAYPE